jgi:hypothetical protein
MLETSLIKDDFFAIESGAFYLSDAKVKSSCSFE